MNKELWWEPHSRTCLAQGEAASCRPLCLGCALRPGVVVARGPVRMLSHALLTRGHVHWQGAAPGLQRRACSFTCCTCYALSPWDLDTGNRTSPTLHPSCSHSLSSARRPPVFASVQFPPMDPESTLALGIPFQQPHTHSCPRLLLTVPRHHYICNFQHP